MLAHIDHGNGGIRFAGSALRFYVTHHVRDAAVWFWKDRNLVCV